MTTRSLLRILLLLGVGWLTFMTPMLLSLRSIWRHADGYFRAEYLVADDCESEEEAMGCYLEGQLLLDRGRTSRDEELFVYSSLTHPAGTRIAVFYNPTVAERSERLLNATGADDVEQVVRRGLWQNARLLLLVLGSAALVHVLLRTGPGRVARGPRRLAIDLGGVAPGGGPVCGATPAVGTVLFAHGLTFLALQISNPQIGGIVLGLVLAAAGTPLLVRRFLVLAKDEGRAVRGWHFLGLAFGGRQQGLPDFARVDLQPAVGGLVIFITGPGTRERVEVPGPLGSARDRARRLASFLGVPLEDATAAWPTPPDA